MFNKAKVAFLTAVASVASVATGAFAAAQDYTAIGTGVEAEITSALGTALPIGGTLLGVFVGWKVLRRFIH